MPETGFPSPAKDFIDNDLDLNTYLVANRPSTFFVRAVTNDMADEGILSGDLLIVDKAKKAGNGSVVLVNLEGEISVRKLVIKGFTAYLQTAPSRAKNYPTETEKPTKCTPETVFWGVVTHSVHSLVV